ncbi:shikimate kinase [Gilvimarinus polysaccharolyticus]|uniref:shikimate kinase n=1 Tax=Gilvimarinus polysaccharolyticus TaxID=863921 RepID=UPI000A5FD21F|nr:shikimate kinase [Gilvimarinus polysaccharolyticus]
MTVHGESIVFIGMPGAGKSTIGVLLAKELAREFVDTDLLIQVDAGKTLQDIVYESDYRHLRQLEEATILTLNCDRHVIATGGSVIYSDTAMQHLKSLGQVVFLDLPLADVETRVENFSTRGIASPEGQNLADIYAERQPLYQRHANITIDCRGKTPAQIVSEVIYEEGGQYADKDA